MMRVNAYEYLLMEHNRRKEEYDAKVKELEAIFNPIMTKIYQQTGGAPEGLLQE